MSGLNIKSLSKAFVKISFFLDLVEIILQENKSFCFIFDKSWTDYPLSDDNKISLFADPECPDFIGYYKYPVITHSDAIINFFAPYDYSDFIGSYIGKHYYDELIFEAFANLASDDKNPREMFMLVGNASRNKQQEFTDKKQISHIIMINIDHLAEIFTDEKTSTNQDLFFFTELIKNLKKILEKMPQIHEELKNAREEYIKKNSLTESTITEDDEKKIEAVCDEIWKKYSDEFTRDADRIKAKAIPRDAISRQLRENVNLDKIVSFFLNYFNSATLVIASDIADYIRSGVLTERPDVFNSFTSIELISLRNTFKLNDLPLDSKKIMERFDGLVKKYGPQSSTHGGSSNTINIKNNTDHHNEYLIIVVIVIFLFLMVSWIRYFQPRDSYRVPLLNTLPMNDNNFFGDVGRGGHSGVSERD